MRSLGGVIDHTQLTGVTANQHHAQLHQAAHRAAAADELPVNALALFWALLFMG